MNNQNRGHGFIPDIIKDEDYIFGALKIPQVVFQPDGQWDKFLPVPEYQERNGLETYNCTSYGTLNAIEALFLRLFSREVNKSERYIGVMSKTSPQGNSPQKVIETIRKESGLIDERLLPFDKDINTWEEYYSPNPMTKKYIKEGKKWLENFSIKHEWLKPITPKKIMSALQCSPLGISVSAWFGPDDKGLYIKPEGEQDNHWVCLYGFEEGEYWKVFDSYDNTRKKLAWDYDFGFAKRYYLEEVKKKESLWQKVKKCLEEVLDKIATIKGD